MRPVLWETLSSKQVFLTSLLTGVLGLGPAASVTANIPDRHHFRGSYSGKDIVPLWRDAAATSPNITAGLLSALSTLYSADVHAEDLLAYCYAILGTPSYVDRFSEELTIPGPRIPVTKEPALFDEAVKLGRRLVWLHTYGERFVPAGMQMGDVPQGAARNVQAIPDAPDKYPETFSYESSTETLTVGDGVFAPVPEAVWFFSVSGFQVVRSWLSYRMKSGAGRKSSSLDDIRPERWTPTMTEELLELLWVLEATLAMYPTLGELLDRIVAGETFRAHELPKPSASERAAPSFGDRDQEQLAADLT